jgi:hypothetical protein
LSATSTSTSSLPEAVIDGTLTCAGSAGQVSRTNTTFRPSDTPTSASDTRPWYASCAPEQPTAFHDSKPARIAATAAASSSSPPTGSAIQYGIGSVGHVDPTVSQAIAAAVTTAIMTSPSARRQGDGSATALIST